MNQIKEHLCVSLVPLFNHLSIADQKRIHQLVQHFNYEKQEIILSPYSEAALVIVAKGALKVYQLASNGKEQLLRIVEAGGYEGENFLLGVKNENLFAESIQKTEVCILKQKDFYELLEVYPELSLKLLAINAQKNTQVERQAQFLSMERIEERLATYLLDLATVAKSDQVEIPMKLRELATFLGTTPETLSRKLKFLEAKQLIKRNKRKIRILDFEELEDM
ncbi:MAG TPA: Crp/Fnr family transcriptional regulator [Tetragenococcus sp.]|nr:Crp/Fnr family transcriptional regulator [Tetragenococcus sp.]